jgi:hypothetical protein
MRFFVLTAFAVLACNAELDKECVPPGANCESYAVSTATTGSAGGGGSGGGTACFEGCDIFAAGPTTGELPCDVEAVLGEETGATGCRRCHSVANQPTSGAPFPLETYADTQALHPTTPIAGVEPTARFARFPTVLNGGEMPGVPGSMYPEDYMPLVAPKLSADEKAVLVAWACSCAPARPAGEMCP